MMNEKSIPIGVVSRLDNLAQRAERKDAAANRQLLLKTAQALFAAQGVAEVNMADVAREAGVGKGTLYRRFANKSELCLALLDEALQTFQDEMLVALREMVVSDTLYLTQLHYFLDRLVYFVAANLPLMCEIERTPMGVEGLVQDVNRPHFWQEMTVRALLQQAVARGEITAVPELDVPYTASALMALYHAPVLRYQLMGQQFTAAQISAGIQRLLVGLTR